MSFKRCVILLCLFQSQILLAEQTIASGEINLATLIKKNNPSPYDGILLPESEYRLLESSKIEKDVLLNNISKMEEFHNQFDPPEENSSFDLEILKVLIFIWIGSRLANQQGI